MMELIMLFDTKKHLGKQITDAFNWLIVLGNCDLSSFPTCQAFPCYSIHYVVVQVLWKMPNLTHTWGPPTYVRASILLIVPSTPY